MAELGLAVVGLVGQIFDGCITAYALFTAARNLGRDSERLVCKIRIEEMRLRVWGREWGVSEGRLEEHLRKERNAGNEKLTELAVEILSELYKTITDFNRLKERYGIEQVDGVKREGMSRLRNEFSMRAKWVIGDKEKFELFLMDLKDYNDGLEQLFPPSKVKTLRRTWTNELLQTAQSDLEELDLLESAADGVYEQLNRSAGLKKLKINMDNVPAKAFKASHAFKVPRDSLSISDKDSKRSHGAYQTQGNLASQEVLIEWVKYERNDVDARFNHVRRIDDLARMVHSASQRHPDLHTLDCLGYTDDTATSRYGLIYEAPEASFSSLNALIASNDLRTPDLGDRFQLAHSLAIALWSLHSLDWLHKSVSSNNILFFPSAFSNAAIHATVMDAMVPDISSPYLIGFDSSRPVELGDLTVASKNRSVENLHRHPNSLGDFDRKPYCKCYDVYSLGLVLLEIGLWKTLQTYHKARYSPEKFRDKVIISALIPNLSSKTGRRYKEIVEMCLFAKENMTGLEAGQLMESIVGALEGLRV